MDGNRFNQCAKRLHDDGVDRISLLPDEIIVAILSFLSPREAAATSVLSLRWVDLWKHTPNLNFTASELKLESQARSNIYLIGGRGRLWVAERCKYIQLVNFVINSHKAPSLKQFAISFYVNHTAKCIVAKWLEFAYSRGVERLELDFRCIAPKHMVVLEELLRESGLCSSPETLILFQSLKRLCISGVSVSGEAVKIFLLNCPLLEELIICCAHVTSDVEICGATLVLKHLEMYCCNGDKSLRVSAPNLTRLKFDDLLGKLFLESVPKLVEATFSFNGLITDVGQNVASALIRVSPQLEILNLSLRRPQEFLAYEFAEMPKLRKLEVDLCTERIQSLLPVTALLWASPHLQEFKLKCYDIGNGDAAVQVRRNDVGQNVASALFRVSPQLEILNISLRRPQEFLAYEFAEMPKLRKLEVELCTERIQSLLPVTALLWASPHLQEFKLKCYDIGNGDAAVQVRRNGESPHLHLRLFELEGFADDVTDGHIELVTYISDNCVGLEKIKISLGSSFTSIDQKQVARNNAQQRLQGKLPQHIQLQLS